MIKYEELLEAASIAGITVKEVPLQHTDGITVGKKIGIRTGQSTKKKTCVLAEELAHAQYTVGNILDQSDVGNRKQELLARTKAYDRLIGLSGIVQAFKHGCRNQYEMADFLDVTEKFLREALECYKDKYGLGTTYGDYIIQFEPCLSVSMKI